MEVQTRVITVTEYSARLGRALREVGPASLEGEVQKVTRTQRGMLYFDLTDGESLLSCKVFSRDAAGLEHQPRAGDLVQVQVDRPDLYAARGSLSLIVSAVALAGEGELLRRRAELLARLTADGLCDLRRRRALPPFPRAVGVIAGARSDGLSDVIRALTDRWPAVHIITCTSLVQGASAPVQLIDALARLQQHPLVDVIVLARGGGSVQDLACFDDERLCRALFACETPVVCAIGHTDNNPACNHVTWSAFTPSRSAELVVPSLREIRHGIAAAGEHLRGTTRRLAVERERLAGSSLGLTNERVTGIARHVDDLGVQIRRSVLRAVTSNGDDSRGTFARLVRDAEAGIRHRNRRAREVVAGTGALVSERTRAGVEAARRDAQHQAHLIAARDFRHRGWLLASTPHGGAVRSVADLTAGAPIHLHLHDGRAEAVVENVIPEPGA